MDNILEKIKDNFGKAVESAEKYSKLAVDKTSSAIDKAKVSIAVNDAEKKIKDILAEIGEYVYTEFCNGAEFSDELAVKCEEIGKLKSEIAELKKAVICAKCGEYNPMGNEFCGKCGEKIE